MGDAVHICAASNNFCVSGQAEQEKFMCSRLSLEWGTGNFLYRADWEPAAPSGAGACPGVVFADITRKDCGRLRPFAGLEKRQQNGPGLRLPKTARKLQRKVSGPKSPYRLDSDVFVKRVTKIRMPPACVVELFSDGERTFWSGEDERKSRKIQTRARCICLAKVDEWCAWFLRASRLDK